MTNLKNISVLIFTALCMVACGDKKSSDSEEAAEKPAPAYQLRKTLEHDQDAFTQGLVFYNDKIIESTGRANSWIAEYDLETGEYEKKVVLNENYFGEGITVLNDKLYQLTWKSGVGFVYDARTFKKLGEFEYDFEGWGITHDHQYLIISDGTDQLHYLDTLTLKEAFTRSVKQYGRETSNLNELEFIEGYIYANQWETNSILKIDTSTYEVVKALEFNHLAKEAKRANPQADVLNGIAYNPKTREVYITGKLWAQLYVVRLSAN